MRIYLEQWRQEVRIRATKPACENIDHLKIWRWIPGCHSCYCFVSQKSQSRFKKTQLCCAGRKQQRKDQASATATQKKMDVGRVFYHIFDYT